MPLSLQQLRTPLTRSEAAQWVVDTLKGLGFNTTGWQPGSIPKTLTTLFGLGVASFSHSQKQTAEYGSNEFGTGAALKDYSRTRYGNEYFRAVRTRGPMTLRNVAAVPYTAEVGQLIGSTDLGVQFRNITAGTIPAGTVATPGSVVLEFESIVAGVVSIVPRLAVRRMITSLAGVSISNDAPEPWYTVAGQDEESDANLRLRNSTKWARLTVELVRDSYVNIALTESNGAITKVEVDDRNPRGPGTLDVYVAGPTALVAAPVIAAMQATFAARAFDTDAFWPPNGDSRVYVKHPLTTPPLDIACTVFHEPGFSGTSIQEAVRLALLDFLAATPIGGWDFSPGLPNVVTRGDLLEAMENVEGVRTVVMTTPGFDVLVNPHQLVVEGSWTITPVAVTS